MVNPLSHSHNTISAPTNCLQTPFNPLHHLRVLELPIAQVTQPTNRIPDTSKECLRFELEKGDFSPDVISGRVESGKDGAECVVAGVWKRGRVGV
jgi:hypothetical protein